jgi:DNA-binding response OmpR family regulator
MTGQNILVIDDFAYIQLLFKNTLSKEGYQVHTAKTGQDAVKLIEQITFDLIILDINLPDINGVDLLSKLRQAGINIPVIIVSAFASSDLISNLSGLNVSGVFSKPVILEDFIVKLSEIFSGGKKSDEPSKRLILLDENENIRNKLTKMFSKENYSLLSLGDGYEVISVLKNENNPLVIVDLDFSGNLTGIEVIRNIRQYSRDTKIIALTASASRDMIIECKELNVNDFFVKPFNVSDFRDRAVAKLQES